MVLIAAFSAYAGYNSGITLRKEAEVTQVSQRIDQQYQLGLQDMSEGQYNRARQRFEYVIQLDPNYPGVTEKLADVLLQVNTTATPTIVPTPTLTPTPDLRSVQDLYTQSQEALNNGDWTKAIDALLTLRKNDPNYQAVQVDDMMFMALRNRGKDKIGKLADLEGGIYDLSLAERFGPLDSEAQGFQTWARLYITGASFWDIDWKQAVYYFSQVAPALPNLRDGSGMTANERYRQALIGYGNMVAKDDPCAAQEQYQLALSLGPDAKAEEALGEAVKNCSGGQDEQQSSGENNLLLHRNQPLLRKAGRLYPNNRQLSNLPLRHLPPNRLRRSHLLLNRPRLSLLLLSRLPLLRHPRRYGHPLLGSEPGLLATYVSHGSLDWWPGDPVAPGTASRREGSQCPGFCRSAGSVTKTARPIGLV